MPRPTIARSIKRNRLYLAGLETEYANPGIPAPSRAILENAADIGAIVKAARGAAEVIAPAVKRIRARRKAKRAAKAAAAG